MDQLIPGADPDLIKPLHGRIRPYEAIHRKTKVTQIEAQQGGPQGDFEPRRYTAVPEPQL
jgi:dihydrolipoamide dehydrogenase